MTVAYQTLTKSQHKRLRGMGLRFCPDCSTVKIEHLWWSSKNASYCKPCNTSRARTWAQNNPERAARNMREAQYKRKYGIDIAEFDRMVEAQTGKCKICRDQKDSLLVVDHDHETGAVRGLLCQKCNVSLGRLGDNEESILRVLAYLRGGI